METMLKLGLKRTESDACLLMGQGILVLIHADDFQILSPSNKEIDKFTEGMRQVLNQSG